MEDKLAGTGIGTVGKGCSYTEMAQGVLLWWNTNLYRLNERATYTEISICKNQIRSTVQLTVLYQCWFPGIDTILKLHKMSPLGEAGQRVHRTLWTKYLLQK
jgi:hypothetical protein